MRGNQRPNDHRRYTHGRLIVQRLQQRGDMQYALNAQAITARETWQAAFSLPYALGAEPLETERLAARLETTTGGQNLIKIGLQRDILVAAQLDQFQSVPALDVEDVPDFLAHLKRL